MLDGLFVPDDNFTREDQIFFQKFVVEGGPILQIYVLPFLNAEFHEFSQDGFDFWGAGEEKFAEGGEALNRELQVGLLGDLLAHAFDDVGGHLDFLSVLAQDPDVGLLGFGVGKEVEADLLDEFLDDAVLAHDVFHDDHELGGDVVGFEGEEVLEEADDLGAGLGEVDADSAEALNGVFRNFLICISDVFIELGADIFDVGVGGDLSEDLELEALNINGFVVLEEEVLIMLGKLILGFLNKKTAVGDDGVADFVGLCGLSRGHEGDEGVGDAGHDFSGEEVVVFGEVDEDFDGAEEDGGGGVFEAGFEEVHDVEFELLFGGGEF